MDELVEWSAQDVLRAFSERRLSPVEYLQGLFERIDVQSTAEAADVLAGTDLIAEHGRSAHGR